LECNETKEKEGIKCSWSLKAFAEPEEMDLRSGTPGGFSVVVPMEVNLAVLLAGSEALLPRRVLCW
jgi:hypothetical protein